MNDELLVISPLDQDLSVDDDDHVLEKIEGMILQSIQEHDHHKAIHICKQLIQITKLSGLALAKSLYLLKSNWDEFDLSDNFDDVMAGSIGLHKATIQRYTSVWKMYETNLIPDKFEDAIMQKSMKTLIPIAQALDAGYEIDDEEWEELVDAPDFSVVNAKLREIKGKEPRSNALILMMDREGGLKAIKNDEQVYIGFLNISDENEVVQQAITRLVKGSGILEQ